MKKILPFLFIPALFSCSVNKMTREPASRISGFNFSQTSQVMATYALLPRGTNPEAGYAAYGFVLSPSSGQESRDKLAQLCYRMTENLNPDTDTDFPLPSRVPTYWLVRQQTESHSFCSTAIPDYDYERARDLTSAAGLKGSGPFLVAWQIPFNSQNQLEIDLGALTPEQMGDVVEWWKDKVVQSPSTWQEGYNFEILRWKLVAFINTRSDGILKAFTFIQDGQSIQLAAR
ncbi:hypothetical protein [Photobacterium sp. TY1-4]|uniref:hypothetical protein n=1 Tax=Photobacterium sp. TY1-4 TaxID=2899122 RepID=UPI0021BEE621|nr:hypothetical protein [Photobacterium sp. TY1-4]UXI04705.1 hypothetical protein NH461_25405 [Photobacterium sp. TY1-4]